MTLILPVMYNIICIFVTVQTRTRVYLAHETLAKIKEGITKLTATKVSRPGIHAKSKTSKLKKSKNYKKNYKAQGR